jgi:short-chain fatty acids transporter
MGLIWTGNFLVTQGIGKLDLNSLNFIILILGLILHKTPRNFVASVGRGVGTVGGVIIQFPLYAGIFGMIQNSGLSDIIAGWFVSISTKDTFPLINFYYSGFMNMFVPSGGSKFVIEAPYMVPAAIKLGTPVPYVINSYVLGDMWTNMIQPFWALPILGAFKLPFQRIMPYGFTMVIVFGILLSLCIYFLPFIM